jgi:hypothetical protein
MGFQGHIIWGWMLKPQHLASILFKMYQDPLKLEVVCGIGRKFKRNWIIIS